MSTTSLETWKTSTTELLIDHLISCFHDRHRQHLPELIGLARTVEAVHGQHSACPNGLTQHLQTVQQELESHMLKEEQVLFPMLRQLRFAQASMPIRVMMMEHKEHEQALEQIENLTTKLKLPEDACGTWQLLYKELALFIAELQTHIQLENTILFAGKTSDAQTG